MSSLRSNRLRKRETIRSRLHGGPAGLMFNLTIYFVAVVCDDGGVRTKITLQSPACFVSYKSWLSVHGTCNEGKHREILSNLCGQFSGDITATNTGLCTTTLPAVQHKYVWKQLDTEPGGPCWTTPPPPPTLLHIQLNVTWGEKVADFFLFLVLETWNFAWNPPHIFIKR